MMRRVRIWTTKTVVCPEGLEPSRITIKYSLYGYCDSTVTLLTKK